MYFENSSDSDSEQLNVFNNVKLTTIDKKVCDLLQHQVECKLSHKGLERTAKFSNKNASIALPDSANKIKKRAEELRKLTYNLKYEILIVCKKCQEIVSEREKKCPNCQTCVKESVNKKNI